MLDNTKNFFIVLLDDIKKLLKGFEILSILITIGYAIAAMILEVGNFWINTAILSVTAIYGIIKLIIRSPKIDTTYKSVKLFISALSLAISIYGIYVSTISTNGVVIIMATLMVIFWVLQFFTLIMQLVLNRHIKMLKACAFEDFKPLFKVERVANALKGKEDTYEELDEETLAKVNSLGLKSAKIKEKKAKEALEIKRKTFKNIPLAEGSDEVVNLDRFIKDHINSCIVNKQVSLKPFLKENSNHKMANRLVSFGPIKDVTENQLRLTAGSLILKELPKINYDHISMILYVKGAKTEYTNILSHKDEILDLLILAEKIIYIYGFPEIRPNYPLTDNTLKALRLALSIMVLNDASLYHDLYELAKEDANPINSTKRLVGNIKGGVNNLTKQIFPNNDDKSE